MRVVVSCLAPLNHGAFGESAGNATLCRRMPVVSLPGSPRIPCVSGNALRGSVRRLVMRDLFTRANLSRETLPGPRWDRLYAALANGGHLEGSETRTDPDRLRALRKALPPLSIFGSALYTYLLPGRVSVGILWLRCKETREANLVSDAPGLAPGKAAEDLVDEVTHCRHVDREEQDPQVSGVTPMPTTVEVIATGAVLESSVLFDTHATLEERGAWAYGLSLLRALGGKGAGGLGRIDLDLATALETEPGAIDAYRAWLGGGTAEGSLRELAATLAPSGPSLVGASGPARASRWRAKKSAPASGPSFDAFEAVDDLGKPAS